MTLAHASDENVRRRRRGRSTLADLILACGARVARTSPRSACGARPCASRRRRSRCASRCCWRRQESWSRSPTRRPKACFLRGDDGASGGGTPGGGACVGGLFGDPGSWWRTGSAAPDGTYALARWDARAVELLSDICASRTLWYALGDDAFLASTSQRALVMLLGGFELEPEATACFLTSGTLGPEVSWDARLRRLPPDARVALDRDAWRITVHEAPFELNEAEGDAAADVARLRDAISGACGGLNLDLGRWVLPLSGGHDSRALLAFLVANGLSPRCVTWTTRKSLRNPLSDASIARLLARRYHVEHELLFLDVPGVPLETTIARFVAANEGRNDEIAGYLDGFALWRDLALAGVQGIIRGDESFGPISRPMQPEAGRRQVGGATPDDYPDAHVLHKLGLARQTWPPRLHKRAGEGLRDYRLRLSQQGYLPIILAGLSEPKARYVEIVNPHLARRVIGAVRSLSPRSRTQARAFRDIVDGLDRVVPYARASSTLPVADLLDRPDMRELLVRELMSADMERVLPGDGPLFVLAAMATATGENRSARSRLRALAKEASSALPTRLAARLAPPWKGPDPLPPAKVALRAMLANRTLALLGEDARSLAGPGDAAGDPGQAI